MYTVPYFATKKHPAILVCLTVLGNVYPVVEHPKESNSLVGKHLVHGYQTHYVVTSQDGYPLSQKDYQQNVKKYDEIVLGQEAQVVPIFLLKIAKKTWTN